MRIKEVKAEIIKNSRNENTIKITINRKFSCSSPSGASTGQYEAPVYGKKGLNYSVRYINKEKDFINLAFSEFKELNYFDQFIQELGANPVIAMQGAILKAISENKVYKFLNEKAKKLPTPLGNCIGGGAHIKKESIDIQEFLLIPRSGTFSEKMLLNEYIYKKLIKSLNPKQFTDEKAISPNISDIESFDFLYDFLSKPENTLDNKLSFGIDLASTQLFSNNYYFYKNFSKTKKQNKMSREEQIEFINDLIYSYKLKYIEDPLEENDFEGFSRITKSVLVCGDDLIATNLERLKKAISHNSINSIIVKPNQIGSLIKMKEIVDYARNNNIATVISHRSGETNDTLISHLAVAWEIPYIKTGIAGDERKAKLQELSRIESEIVQKDL